MRKIENNVFIQDANIFSYDNSKVFNPADFYPEGLNLNIKSDKLIYDNIRNLFISMNLDKKNIGTKYWNPLKEIINLNDNVVIKPNLVYHINKLNNGTMDSMITNFSIIRPIIDYVILALNKTGNIIVGDAPVQECIFEKVIAVNDLDKAIDIYNKAGYKVKLCDFRKNNNPELECITVSLDKDSSLSDIDKYYKQFAISNYDLRIMHEHHAEGKHEYLIPKDILNADVIINLPKAKTHRIAGITACMKNFVGANAKKEYLPHHRNGNIHHHGDEYPERSMIKACQSYVKNYTYLHNKFVDFINLGLRGVQKLLGKNRYLKGMWYGNDTIWRTILDINKVIIYADKNGIMQDKHQRKILNIADMIISGEKEGPLTPTAKPVGLLVAGLNQLNVDKVICHIMGFDVKKIKFLMNGYNLTKYKISESSKFDVYDQLGKVKNIKKYNRNFCPSDGWNDYLKNK